MNSSLTLINNKSEHPDYSDLVLVPKGSQIEGLLFKERIKYKNQKFYLLNAAIAILKKN